MAPLYSVKRLFVQRRAVKGVTADEASAIDGGALAAELDDAIGGPVGGIAAWEQRYAEHVAGWLDDEAHNADRLELAARYAAWATLSPDGQRKHHRGVLFKVPHRLDMNHLVPVETVWRDGVDDAAPAGRRMARVATGFALTDPGTDLVGALDQANYCIWCHNQGKDSCSQRAQGKGRRFPEERRSA